MGAERSRRWVVHIDMDAFFASVEQLTRPTLAGRPVLVGGVGGRGVVAGASYEARVFGARSAMPMHQARRLIGVTAVVLPPRGAVYRVASARVFDTIRALVPVIEQLSFDEAFAEPVELAGATVDEVREFGARLRGAVADATGLVASVGVGTGKQSAKIASGLAKPDGIVVISPSRRDEVLRPLPVRKLWGIGPVAGEKLARLGVDTIGDLADLTSAEVASVLGQTVGPGLHLLARGVDDRPVAERAEAKQISAESTYAVDLTTISQVHQGIDVNGHSAFRRLVTDGRAARTITVKLKKTDMSVLSRSSTLPYATADEQILLTAARKLAMDPMVIGPIRLVGVSFSGLSLLSQESLFPELDVEEHESVAEELPEREVVTVSGWRTGDDVTHPEFGHGWVQGIGHGVMSVRFETRATGAGRMRSLRADDPAVTAADPVASLAWE